MKQVVRRLELISAAISLGESSIIESQTKKLRNFPLDEEAETITAMLEKKSYEETIPSIKIYLKKFTGLYAYENPILKGIRLEIKTFEQEIAALSHKKYSLIKNRLFFNKQYHESLGEIVKDILQLKSATASRALSEKKIDKKEFIRIENKLMRFQEKNLELESIQQKSLQTYEQQELERVYKKTARIINPKIVIEEFKNEVKNIFSQLNFAYIHQDLEGVNNISANLEDDASYIYSFDSVEDKKVLRKQSKTLRKNIESLQNQLNETENSNISMIVSDPKTLQAYLSKTKKALIQKRALLQQNR